MILSKTTAPEAPQEPAMIPLLSRWIGSWRVSVARRAHQSAELQRLYDHAAPNWSRKLSWIGLQSAYEGIFLRLLQSALPSLLTQTVSVLDCGIGAGDMSAALVSLLGPSIDLHGVDLSAEMLRQAELRLARLGVAMTPHAADACQLPFADNSFDIVMTGHMLEHMADPQLALRELRRVLKPGGIMLASITRQSLWSLPIQLKWRAHGVTPERAVTWFEDAGFVQASCLAADHHGIFNRLSVVCTGRKPSLN